MQGTEEEKDYCKGTFSSTCEAVNLFWQTANIAAPTTAFQCSFTSDLIQYNFPFFLPSVRYYFYPDQQADPNDSTHESQQTESKLVFIQLKSSSTFGALHFQSLQTYPNTSRRHSWPVAFDFCHLWTRGTKMQQFVLDLFLPHHD